ncbi:MAG: DEAD/DEAH box helicase [Bryobacterales bacterium]|jgi:ATP-dependent RNA helicase RhlE|nr:DEAD/DEAH box helicase [Bryobacterales bacterium]
MNLFSELSINSVLQSNLAKHGFVHPTPVQSKAIPPALAGRDVVATAQTGTGKTLAFVLPLLESLMSGRKRPGVQAIILSPTRELAIQIQETFLKVAEGTGIRSACVVGGMNERPQLDAIKRGAQVLIGTPGRLEDFLQRKLVQPFFNRVLVLDEADRMLDMGFLPSIQRIVAAIPAQRQTLFFSATIEKSVAHLVDRYLNDPVRVAIGSTSEASAQVELHAYEIAKEAKFEMLVHLLEQDPAGTFLVFARTKHGADRLARQLERAGYDAAAIHGNRTQSQRNNALKGFQSGEHRILVATDVASRGIHVDSISHVVNFDLPQAPEDFIHRVGRTGRAGSTGIASTFVAHGERGEVRRIEKEINARLERQSIPARVAAVRGTEGPAYGSGAESGGRPTGSRPTGSRPTGGQPTGGQPTGGRPTGGAPARRSRSTGAPSTASRGSSRPSGNRGGSAPRSNGMANHAA